MYVCMSQSIICESPWCNGKRVELQDRCKQVRSPVTLLRSLSDQYSVESYEHPNYPHQ